MTNYSEVGKLKVDVKSSCKVKETEGDEKLKPYALKMEN